MSYTPTTWHGGDVLSAEAMNKIEQGIADSGRAFLVEGTQNDNTITLNKTYNEIKTAFLAGQTVILVEEGTDPFYSPLFVITETNGDYIIVFFQTTFVTDSINGYPEYNLSETPAGTEIS